MRLPACTADGDAAGGDAVAAPADRHMNPRRARQNLRNRPGRTPALPPPPGTADHKSPGQCNFAVMPDWWALGLGHLIHFPDLRLFGFMLSLTQKTAGQRRAG